MDFHNLPKPTPKQLAARRRAMGALKGIWKGEKLQEIIREMEEARKSWDRRVDQLDRERDRLRKNQK